MRPLDEIEDSGAAWVTESELAALVRVAREANHYLDLNYGYESMKTRDALEPLVRALEDLRD